MYPENYLHTDLQKINFEKIASKGEVNADIISFNYTKTVESLLDDYLDKDNYYSDSSTSGLFRVRSIKHIHGTLNGSNILFGVNDIFQIGNERFREDESFQDLLIKPKGNTELGIDVDKECLTLIQNAKVFYIFGTSLGPTDQFWWEQIGYRFRNTSDTVILYFDYKPEGLKKICLTGNIYH